MTPVALPTAVLAEARATARTLAALTGVEVDAAEVLGGRSVSLGLPRGDTVSAGGATRLMGAADGWCALTLARSDDLDAVPALVEANETPDPWAAVRERVRTAGVHATAERARLLGLPIGVLGETDPAPPVVRTVGARAHPRPLRALLVADLSSMWAGPLCGRLLARAGATVVKVESPHRPDGTRAGPVVFYDWVNAGKLSYAVDFAQPEGLARLLAAADVVLESSRPAALHDRGLGPAEIPARDGRIWVQITGHGAVGERAHWVAFGDDAAVSGGLVGGTATAPTFCGDAVADPLTGLEAARAVLESHARGGGEVIGVAMAAVAARYAAQRGADETLCSTALSATEGAARLGDHNALVDDMVARRLAAAC